ncbi:MAG: aspartate kinase [Candidatus Hodarchaeota archaeon]
MKVMKIGGGCLKDAANFLRVADVIRSEDEPTIVVVSAISGVTDLLIDAINLALESEKNVSSLIEAIRTIHKEIIEESIRNNSLRQQTLMVLESKIQKLMRLLYGIAYTGEITDSTRASIVSYGERLSSLTMAGILNSQGILAEVKEADIIGIVTDSSFDNATALMPIVKKNLQKSLLPLLNEGYVPVITGYFGCTENGKITTFGRNGTDYSAAVVTCALDAQTLDIWKDVDGFMSADPNLVEGVQRIDQLSFYEAAELSYFGAKILHPRTVEPLVDADIKVYIRNICDPASPGTEISSNGYEKKDIIKSVTYNKDIAVLKIHGPGVGYKPGIIGNIGQQLSMIGINIYSVLTSQTCINLLVDRMDSKKSFDALQKLTGGVIERIVLEDDLALIAVVGEGLRKTKGLAAKVFSAVAEKEVNVEMISSGASEVAYYFIVKEIDLEAAIKAIHSTFFMNV